MSPVLKNQVSTYRESYCSLQYIIWKWKKLSLAFSNWCHTIGSIVTFMAPPRNCECVPDWYRILQFWPNLIFMHIQMTSLIGCYTRNARNVLSSYLIYERHHFCLSIQLKVDMTKHPIGLFSPRNDWMNAGFPCFCWSGPKFNKCEKHKILYHSGTHLMFLNGFVHLSSNPTYSQ